MGTVIIVVVLAALCIFTVYKYVKKLRYGGGCCGEHEPAEKKVKVEDRDKSHYPYTVTLTIDGMTCGNCARRVENALNRLDGVWATVDLGAAQAKLLLKKQPEEAVLRQAVRDAGYAVTAIRQGDGQH
ncbi:cation transporter [Solibaculum mannosilyticum]|uniref:cation transporter n=1 Tax=Solibaculum mannosilyticum TaxID=2780922 RepID=UPI000C06A280|nr:cation transporter [[Clostridium] leptum]